MSAASCSPQHGFEHVLDTLIPLVCAFMLVQSAPAIVILPEVSG